MKFGFDSGLKNCEIFKNGELFCLKMVDGRQTDRGIGILKANQ